MDEIIKEMVEKFKDKQMIIAIEELSELQKEICKALRGQANKQALIEEVADVEIILKQIKYYYNLKEEEIKEKINYKLERTKRRYL